MTAKRRAGVVIDIVANELDLPLQPEPLHRFEQKQVTRPVVADNIGDGHTFRRAILEVLHVDVDAATIEEKPPVARRFVPVTIVLIDQPVTVILEEPVANPGQDLPQL